MSDKHNNDFDFDDEFDDEFEEDDDLEDDEDADYPKNDFVFDIGENKVLFKNVAWHEPTNIHYLTDNEFSKYLEFKFRAVPSSTKINTSTTYNSAEDFYFCLCFCDMLFSCTNKPVITPLFDYDCLSEEEFNEQEELEYKYRHGLMPPRITYEFPVSIPYKGQDISCIVRFRDTVWLEKDRFTVELAKGEPVPEGWQKNEYGEYAFPNDDLWKARGFSRIFPAYDMRCAPFGMYLRLGKKKPITGYVPKDMF